jgi:mycoredoxin-dependent peroxiredoxin
MSAACPTASSPGVGDEGAALALPDTGGTDVDVPGGVPTLLVFLPWAFSPICTAEVRQLRDVADDVAAAGVRMLGVSCDAVATLAAWAQAEEPGFELLSDFWPHGAAASAYGVLDERSGAARRVSFLLDADGVVRWTTTAPPGHGRDVAAHLDAVRALGAAA